MHRGTKMLLAIVLASQVLPATGQATLVLTWESPPEASPWTVESLRHHAGTTERQSHTTTTPRLDLGCPAPGAYTFFVQDRFGQLSEQPEGLVVGITAACTIIPYDEAALDDPPLPVAPAGPSGPPSAAIPQEPLAPPLPPGEAPPLPASPPPAGLPPLPPMPIAELPPVTPVAPTSPPQPPASAPQPLTDPSPVPAPDTATPPRTPESVPETPSQPRDAPPPGTRAEARRQYREALVRYEQILAAIQADYTEALAQARALPPGQAVRLIAAAYHEGFQRQTAAYLDIRQAYERLRQMWHDHRRARRGKEE